MRCRSSFAESDTSSPLHQPVSQHVQRPNELDRLRKELEDARSTIERLEADLALAKQRCDDLNIASDLARCAETDLEAEAKRLREVVDSQAAELQQMRTHEADATTKLGRVRGEAEVQEVKLKLELRQTTQACVTSGARRH